MPTRNFLARLSRPRLRRFLIEFAVALSLAFLVWLYTHSRDHENLDEISVPVNLTLAPGVAGQYELEVNGPSRIPVSFSGPPSRIRELRGQLLRGAVQVGATVTVPRERQQENTFRDSVRIDATAVPVPPGVMPVVAEGRNQVNFTVHRLVERPLPVRLEFTGDVRLSQLKVEPATVLVRGPKEILDRTRSIPTQLYVFPASPEAAAGPDNVVRGQVALVCELEGRPVRTNPGSVSFRFRIHPRQKVYEVTDVPVHFLCPADFPWQPRFPSEQASRITVRVLGPAGDASPQVQAFVDLTHGTYRRGRNVEPVRLQLPREFQLAQETAPRVSFQLEPRDGTDE